MAPQEKPRNRNSKSPIEEYVLVITGAPPTCRWQELKDFIRAYAPHSRQAEIYEDENGRPTGNGSVVITRLEEARRAYRVLSRRGWDGHCVRVALGTRANDGNLDIIDGPTTSPDTADRRRASATHANISRHTPAVSPPTSPRSNGYPGYSSAVEPHPAYYATAGTQRPIFAAGQVTDAPNVMAMPYRTLPIPVNYAHYVDVNTVPSYHQNALYNTIASTYTNGHHVGASNIFRHTASRLPASTASDPLIVSPNRTVFLAKLPYSAVGHAVRRLLEAYGRVERCDVPLDRTIANRIQGTAIAKFKEANDAARAISELNGRRWKGVTISAKWDRDSATIASAGSTSGRPVKAGSSSFGNGRLADGSQDDDGARTQRRRPGEGPLIVNGSRGDIAPSRSRRGSKQDDSDSSEDDGDDDDDSNSDEDS